MLDVDDQRSLKTLPLGSERGLLQTPREAPCVTLHEAMLYHGKDQAKKTYLVTISDDLTSCASFQSLGLSFVISLDRAGSLQEQQATVARVIQPWCVQSQHERLIDRKNGFIKLDLSCGEQAGSSRGGGLGDYVDSFDLLRHIAERQHASNGIGQRSVGRREAKEKEVLRGPCRARTPKSWR